MTPAPGGIPFAVIFADYMAVMQDVVRVSRTDGPAAAVERLIDSMVARDIEVPEAPDREQEPTREAGVKPATDEQVEAWDGWPLTTHRASMVIARVRQEQARADSEERGRHQIEDERDTLARRIDHVRTMCADAQVAGGYLRPDAVLYVLDGEPPEAKGPEKEDDRG